MIAADSLPSDYTGRLKGDLINERYQVEEILKWEGLSYVYRCTDLKAKLIDTPQLDQEDRKLLRQCIVKQLPRKSAIKRRSVYLFKREIGITRMLRNQIREIVPIYDWGGDYSAQDGAQADPPYFVMELIEGGTFAKLIQTMDKDAPQTHEERAEQIRRKVQHFIDVAKTVGEIHRAGYIHRDIKPSNILLDQKRQQILLADFGLSKKASGRDEFPLPDYQAETRLGTAVNTLLSRSSDIVWGTLQYMSPEQFGKVRYVTYRSDIYALGVVFFELLTGKPPYSYSQLLTSDARTRREYYKAEHTSPSIPSLFDKNPTIPVYWQEIINKSMAINPEDRYQTAEDMVARLQALLVGSADDKLSSNRQVQLLADYSSRHHNPIRGVALSPDGTFCASTAEFGRIHIWYTASGIDYAVIELAQRKSIKHLFFLDSARLTLGAVTDTDFQLWWFDERQQKFILIGQHNTIQGFGQGIFQYSAETRLFALANKNGKIRVWHQDGATPPMSIDIGCTPNGLTLHPQKPIIAWATDYGVVSQSVAADEAQPLRRHFTRQKASHIGFNRDGSQLVIINRQELQIYEFETQTHVRTHARVLHRSCLDNQHQLVVSVNDAQPQQFSVTFLQQSSKPPIVSAAKHHDKIVLIQLSADSRYIVTGGSRGQVCTWRLR